MAIVTAENLTKHYGAGTNLTKALDGVSLTIAEGEFAAIAGASGSGKSTLLHLLGGLDRPTSGRVQIRGKDLYAMKEEELTVFRRREIGFVFQNYNLVPVLNVLENIVLPAELDGKDPDKTYIAQIVDALGLTEKLSNMPNTLSGGQQQRVALARTLTQSPRIILADEPVAALDPVTAKQVMQDFVHINQELGISILLNIHHVELALEYADRIIGIRAGKIVYDGPSARVDQAVLDSIYGEQGGAEECV